MAYPRELLLVVGLTAGGTAAFYTFTTYMQTFVKLSVGLTADQTTTVISGTLIFACAAAADLWRDLRPHRPQAAADLLRRVPARWRLLPILTTLQTTKSPFTAFLLICGAWVFVAGYTSINAVVKAELFPTNIRALGVGVPYALTVSIFGGTAPAIALYFKQIGHEQWFYYYLSGMIFLSLLIYATMRDTKHQVGDAPSRVIFARRRNTPIASTPRIPPRMNCPRAAATAAPDTRPKLDEQSRAAARPRRASE